MRLRVLGGFALEMPSGADSPALTRHRAEAVLALLAVSGEVGCTRDRLIALLWPESDEGHSRHGLRDALHSVRQALGPDAIVSSGETLRLDPAVVPSDVHSFAQAVFSQQYVDAVRAYGGPLLDGFHAEGAPEFERWLDVERSRLARQFGDALARLATAAEETGAWEEAAAWWARAVEHDPLNSHLVLQRVTALAAMGDRANAIREADAHARLLKQELGLEPDREVLAKIERVRRGEVPPPKAERSAEPSRAPVRAPAAPEPPVATAPRAWPRWIPWAGGGAILASSAVAATLIFGNAPLVVTAYDNVQVTDDPGVEFEPAISPDGNEVAYAAGPIGSPRAFVRGTVNVAGGAAIGLGDSAMGSGWLPAWSPDGQGVRFLACQTDWASLCDWLETGRLGGPGRRLLPAQMTHGVVEKAEVAWSPDGARVAFVRVDTILVASVTDGTRTPVAIHRVGRAEPHSLAWSPDGRFIAYVNGHSGYRIGVSRVANASIWIVNADGGEPQRVTDQDHLNASPAWLDARHLLFVSDRDGSRALYVIEVGPKGARGTPRMVPGVADPHSVSYSIASRKMAYSKFTVRQNIWSYPLDRSVPVSIRTGRPVTTGNQVVEGHDVSPDGRWIVYNGNRNGRSDLYKLPVDGGEAVPLTETPENEAYPRWSPDGREIAFFRRGAISSVWVMSVEGGTPVRITNAGSRPRWSPDGKRIVYVGPPLGAERVWVVSRDSIGGAWHRPRMLADTWCWPLGWAPGRLDVLCEPTGGELAELSPDGRVLWRREVPFGFTEDVRYSPDGKTLYLEAPGPGSRRGVWAIADGGRGAARLVVAFDDPSLAGTLWFSVGRDRLYLSVAEFESDIWVAKLKY